MSKRRIEDEELEELEEETGEDSVEEIQETKKTKPKTEKLELDFSMNAIDRLQKEIDFTDDQYKKVVGNFLIEEFKKDEPLRMAYFTRKVALDAVWDFIVAQARKAAKGKNSCVMSDQEVFGLAIHFVQDGDIKETKSDKVVLTKEVKASLEEQAREEYLAEQKAKLEEAEKKRLEKEKKAKEKALEKEKREREELGMISLFDDDNWG